MSKKALSEADIRSKYITPAILAAGWEHEEQIREEVGFTDGRIFVRGKLHKRGKRRVADYLLSHRPDLPLAVVEAKDNHHDLDGGIQQALTYATALDVPFAFSSNGDGFFFHDRTTPGGVTETELELDAFPSPAELWARYRAWKGIDERIEPHLTQPYFTDGSGRSPRYYQRVAVNRAVEAIARESLEPRETDAPDAPGGRHLLVMATGTGKTYTAFQVIHRLWKSGLKKRILFLADRTALIDQTARNDFRHFKKAMTVVRGNDIGTAHHVYLSLYQGLTSGGEESENAYKQFSSGFFDLVVVDECHRGSARDDSRWREILDHFSSATHLGLTATPKETTAVSSSEYFGDPLYTYSLRQGIDDGFLAPYKVVRVTLDIDAEGWRPHAGFTDTSGSIVPDRTYNRSDYDRVLNVEERRRRVAEKVTEFLKGNDRFAKTIVFCVDIEHARAMRRELVALNADLVAEHPTYIAQITGDVPDGQDLLDAFISPEEKCPVIATTSRLMTTGVDAQTCKLIVLDANIGSMTDFKQIIGRGTRVNEVWGKHYFTILDFRNATDLFADPDFDGDPARVKVLGEEDDLAGLDDEGEEEPVVDPLSGEEVEFPDADASEHTTGGGVFDPTTEPSRREKVTVNGVDVSVIRERVQYLGPDGRIVTESLRDWTRKSVHAACGSLDAFLTSWNDADKKKEIVEALEEQGVFFAALEEEVGAQLDPFDLICHVAYDQPALTRRERAERVKKRDVFTRHGEAARAVLGGLLDKYADEGLLDLENPAVLTLDPLAGLGTAPELIRLFGDRPAYTAVVHELTSRLYTAG